MSPTNRKKRRRVKKLQVTKEEEDEVAVAVDESEMLLDVHEKEEQLVSEESDSDDGGLSRQQMAVARGKFDADAERSVFVGNVPTDATGKEMTKLFRQFGEVESVRFRSAVSRKAQMPKRGSAIRREELHPEIDRINCFVKFVDKGCVAPAMALNNFVLREHHLRVDACHQRGGRHGASSSPVEHDNERCAFVGNLPFACSEEKLRAHFADCCVPGEGTTILNNGDDGIVNVRIIRDRYTGLGKGFGYIEFARSEAVQMAIDSKDGVAFEGRKLRVLQSSSAPEKLAKKAKKRRSDGLSKEQKAEKEMLRRKWFFKAGESTSAGQSSADIAKIVKAAKKKVGNKKNDENKPSAGKKGKSFKKRSKKRKFKPTNAK